MQVLWQKRRIQQGKCPAFWKECRKCGKPNHFESMCKSGHKRRPRQQRIRALSDESDDESNDYFEIHTVTLTDVNSVNSRYSRHSRHIFATMNIIGKNKNTRMTRFQLDSGATCNIITTNVLKELEIKELQKTNQMFNYV